MNLLFEILVEGEVVEFNFEEPNIWERVKGIDDQQLWDLKRVVGDRLVDAKARARMWEKRENPVITKSIQDIREENPEVKYNEARAEVLSSKGYETFIIALNEHKHIRDRLQMIRSDIKDLIKKRSDEKWV